MKNIYLLENKCENADVIISNEEELKRAINLNIIKNYRKTLLVERGDYVTCCSKEDSFNYHDNCGDEKLGGWERGKVLKVDHVNIRYGFYGIFPERGSGIPAHGARLSTQEEIEKYKRKHENGL